MKISSLFSVILGLMLSFPVGADRLLRLSEPQALPTLSVTKSYIYRDDTKKKVLLMGYAIYASARKELSIYDYFVDNVNKNENLGIYANLVRVSYETNDIFNEKFLNDLEQIALYAQTKGKYIIFTPHTLNKVMIPIPEETVAKAHALVANKLCLYNNVMFGLWNEPAYVPIEVWNHKAAELVHIIKEACFPNIRPFFVIPGVKYSRDFRGFKLNASNYVVDVHDYRLEVNQSIDFMWHFMIGKKPVFLGEIAGYLPGKPELVPLQSEEDIRYIKQGFDLAFSPKNRGKIHVMIWRGEDSKDGLRVSNDELSPRGKLYVRYYQKYKKDVTSFLMERSQ